MSMTWEKQFFHKISGSSKQGTQKMFRFSLIRLLIVFEELESLVYGVRADVDEVVTESWMKM